ncbi:MULTISPECIES: TolC family protein [Ramlibacter]|uniref:TolC family protein n=1 Tax=Ramlibacter aquaticus TaxID=2780094 RepID=A0ABR9SF58_9BURK|nr:MULTISPECIES: TolC family protein [Ramlibacter]MBE7940702.1 TolC family protein [Ramlibacter aquaticus]
MRFPSLAVACVLAIPPAGWSQPAASGTPVPQAAQQLLTLPEALALAEAANPVLRAKTAQLSAAQGAATDAGALLQNNPQLSLEGTRRRIAASSGDESWNEWNAGVAQTFEIAGQPGWRREAAHAGLDAVGLEIEHERLQQRAEVARRFYRVLALQRRVAIEGEATRLFDNTAQAVERRRAAGEDTRLDANVALVEAERARNHLASTQEQLLEARAALATPLQLTPQQLPVVEGVLEPVAVGYDEAELLARASAQPRLQALSARERSAQARLKLEQAARYPDVTLGVAAGREGPPSARENLTTFSLSVPLPLFRHNATAIGQAASEASQAGIERQSAERDTPTQVHALWARLQSLRQRIERLERSVLPALSRNEQLSSRSLQAGQIGLLELLITNRQVLDARRELLDALLDYQTTRLTLEATAGFSGRP